MADDKTKTNAEVVTNEEGRTEPIKGKRVRLSNATTPDGAPVFGEIIIDPDTGDLLEYELSEEAKQQLREATNKAIKAMTGDSIPKMTEALKKAFALPDLSQLQATFRELSETHFTDELRQSLRSIADAFKPIQAALDEIEELRPYIDAELSKPEYKGIVLEELLNDYTPRDLLELPADSMLSVVLEAARAAKRDALPNIDTYRADKLNTPVDRVNFLSWDDFKETGGQLKFNMMSEKDKRDPERNALDISLRYALSFGDDPNIKTTKELSHYDRRVYQAIDTIYTSGYDIMLPGDILYNMGNTSGTRSKQGGSQTDKLDASLTKMGTARVYINNKDEAAHYDYPEIVYDGNVLMFERIKVTYKGQTREAIKVRRRPVLMEFADQRNQVTAVPMKALQSGISQTDNHLRIEDYLLYRIVQQKHVVAELQEKQEKRYTQHRQKQVREASKLVILLPTFYERTGNDKKKAIVKQRAIDTAHRYLTHYASEAGGHFIDSYKIDDERITIHLPIK